MKPETITFTKTVEIADANRQAISEGSVLINPEDDYRGVVVRIVREGDRSGPMFACVGDMLIQKSPGSHRVSNRYSKWVHIPHNEQTFNERYLSWVNTPWESFEAQEDRKMMDEALAMSGIMALLPDNIIDDEWGDWPDTFEETLKVLAQYLTDLTKNK